MVEVQSLIDDIISGLSSLRQELVRIREAEDERQKQTIFLSRKNRFLTLLGNIHRQFQTSRDREELLDGISRIIVESGIGKAVWTGRIDLSERSIHPISSTKLDEERFGVGTVRPGDEIRIRGVIADAMFEGTPFIANVIESDHRLQSYHESARRHGYRSLGAFPIKDGEVPVAVAVLFSEEENYFDESTIGLLQQIVDDISEHIHRSGDTDQLQREIDSLHASLEQRRIIADENFIGIAIIQDGRIKYANDAVARLFGYTVDELLAWEANEFTKIIHPDDLERISDPARRHEREYDGIVYYSYRIRTKDNQERHIHRYSKTILYEERHAYLVAFLDDAFVSAPPDTKASGLPDRYRTVFENGPDPAFLADHDGFRILDANNAAISQYGYAESELLGMSMNDLYPADEQSRIAEYLTQLPLIIQTEVTTRHQKRDATIIDVELAARYMRLGEQTVVLFIARDITNKKWAEDVLRESENNYRNVFNAVGHLIFVLDRDARILDLNITAAQTLHLQREDVMGQDFSTVNADEKNGFEGFSEHILHAFDTGQEKFDWWLRRADGETLFVDVLLHRGVYFGHEVVVATVSRKQPRPVIEENTQLFTATLESAPTALAITDSEGRFTWANQAFADLTGFSVEELMERDYTVLTGTEGEGLRPEDLQNTLRRGEIWSDILTIKLKDQKPVELALTVTPVMVHGDTVSRFVLSARNITGEKQRMQQMLQEQKMESIDTISRAIAHDFNNILGIILGYASFLEKRKDDPEKFEADIDEIKQAVQRGANLIKQMLAYTQRNEVSFDAIDVNEIVTDVTGMLSDTFPETIEIDIELGESLPAVAMNRKQLQQILSELCVNARDAVTHPDAPHRDAGRILIQTGVYAGKRLREIFPAAHDDSYVELRVTDNGIGMDENARSKVFDPFFSTKDYGQGRGLGLTAVYGIVRSYNGFIRIDSEPGRGSVFMVYLPLKDRSNTDTTEEDSPRQDIEKNKQNAILVIEDEPSLLKLLRQSLEEQGYPVITARDGVEGVQSYEKHVGEIALVVSDVGLPKLDGFNAFLQMRRINPEVKAILASGYLDEKVKVDLHKEGVSDFIKKPYQADEIVSTVRRLLETSAL
jgi:PAS domain S-box-containing protein